MNTTTISPSSTAKIDTLIREAYEIRNNDTKKSMALSDEALKLSTEAGYEKGRADALCHKGFCNVQLSDYSSAITHLHEALRIYVSMNDEQGLGNVNYNLGITFIRIGDFRLALEHEMKALAFRESSGDITGSANCYMQIGYIYEHFNDQDAALKNYEKTLALHQQTNNVTGIASGLMGIASVYINKNDHEKVKEYLDKCIALRKTINDPRGYGATLHRYTVYHLQNNNYEDARKASEEGIVIAEQAGDKMGQIRFLIVLGKVFFQTKKYDQAIDTLNKAEKMAVEIKLKSIEYEIHLALAEVYMQLNDHKQALDHYILFHKMKEEVLNADIAVKVRNIETIRQMESANKEAEINRLKNVELKKAYREIEEKNKDITDSINYAKRIQQAKLPDKKEIYAALSQSFVLFKPKDIVSGDFYFFHKATLSPLGRAGLPAEALAKAGEGTLPVYIAAADCTGHGVPGALMSMIGSEKLNEAVSLHSGPSEILKQLNKGVKASLRQSESAESTRDGMDIALCAVDTERCIVNYAGANRPLWLIRKGSQEVEEIKAVKTAIGGFTDDNQHFDTHELKLKPGDTFYICTDGYADQFGGPDKKKLMTKKLKEILLSIQDKSMLDQEKYLDNFIENWKEGTEQVDDILVIGIQL